MDRLCYIIFWLLLFGRSYAQLSPTGKTERRPIEKAPGTDTSKIISSNGSAQGRKFTIFSDTSGLRFQQWSKYGLNGTEGVLIASTKKNSTVSSAFNGADADYPGRIYVCWDDEKFYAGDSDVFLAYSDDGGVTWTEPILVTYHPNHKTQFKPQVKTDRKGWVYIVYYDRQNSANNKLTDIYLALSKNGGLKFEYYRLNAKGFKFNRKTTMLINGKPLDGKPLVVAWTIKGKDLHAVRIRDTVLAAYTTQKANEEIQMERSFAFSDLIKVNFSLRKKARVSAIITKPLEPGFEKWIVKNKKFRRGSNTLLIDAKAAKLKKGNYTLTLYYNSGNSFCWIIDE